MKDGIEYSLKQFKRAWKEERMMIVQPFIVGSLLAVIFHQVGKLYF